MIKKKKDTINPWPQLDKLRISSYSCNVLCLLSPKRKKTAYWHHYVIIIIIITIIDCQSILINSHLKSDQLIKYVNKLGSITNRCKKSQHLTVAIERLRARTIPWFFGHFWKCSEVVEFWHVDTFKNGRKIKGSFLLWALQLNGWEK